MRCRLQKEKQAAELAAAEERGKASAELLQLKSEVRCAAPTLRSYAPYYTCIYLSACAQAAW